MWYDMNDTGQSNSDDGLEGVQISLPGICCMGCVLTDVILFGNGQTLHSEGQRYMPNGFRLLNGRSNSACWRGQPD